MTEEETLLSIGEAAELVGTTPRTLRYYEELGLVRASRPSATGQRRYGPAEIERIRHIRELQGLLGLDLDEIGEHLAASDRLEGLRAEFRSGPPTERREAIVDEVVCILERLRARILERQERLASFLTEVDERIASAQSKRPVSPEKPARAGRAK